MRRDWELAEKRAAWRKGICRWCLGPVAPPRITFCGDLCVHEWKLRSSASYLRRMVRKRDKGVCASCGRVTYWEADHVIELAEGGTGALSNVQTLCAGKLDGCHGRKTSEYAARRAARRRAGTRVPG